MAAETNTRCLPTEVNDTFDPSKTMHLYSVTFRIESKLLDQSLWLYAYSHKDAEERVRQAGLGTTGAMRVYGSTPA